MKREFKHQYLFRLIFTAFAFFYIPILVCFGFIFPWVYNEIYATREDHYEELIQIFSIAFEQQVSNFHTAATKLSVNTRNSRSSASVLTSSIFTQNPYYYLECIKALGELDQTLGLNTIVYFPDINCLFTRYFKYTAESFIINNLAIHEADEVQKILDFLNKPGDAIKFYSTFSVYGEKGHLLIGIPVKLGMIKEEALVFFIMDRTTFDFASFYPKREEIQFLVFDTPPKELLYSSGNFFLNSAAALSYAGSSDKIVLYNDDQYRLYKINATFGNTIISIIPIHKIITEIYDFISTMTKIGVIAGILIFLLLCFMVYINYKPIGYLSDEMSEKNLLILDLLLRNLLYGLPVPSIEAEKLGFKKNSTKFAVIIVFNHKFRSEDRKIISSNLYEKFNITSYSTDILYQNYEVVICLLLQDNTTQLKEYFNALISNSGSFEIGPVVTSLESIKDSYQACLDQKYGKEPVHYKKKNSAKSEESALTPQKVKNFQDEVFRYVEEQFCNPQLSQISVADHFGISIYSLSRLFNKDIGIGFSEFITAKRMETAKTLLLTTDKDISEIAKTVGLINTNYFSRLFKSYFGVIPTRYRSKNSIV